MSTHMEPAACPQCACADASSTLYDHRRLVLECPACGFSEERTHLDPHATPHLGHGETVVPSDDGALDLVRRTPGYGVVTIVDHVGIGCSTVFTTPPTEQEISTWRADLAHPDIDPERSYLTIYDPATGVRTDVVGVPSQTAW